jgi:hypothetical protein
MYGGRGDDLINADDDLNTPTAPAKKGSPGDLENNQADTYQGYADVVYGGAGRDVMIHNTGADRLIDWVGEFNSYVVPYSPFGATEVVRLISPTIQTYLQALSKADGADQHAPDSQLALDQRLTLGADLPDPTRNFEPYGELGMVNQHDPDFGDQNGAPKDPQAGNLQAQRDTRFHDPDPIPTTSSLANSAGGTTPAFAATPPASFASVFSMPTASTTATAEDAFVPAGVIDWSAEYLASLPSHSRTTSVANASGIALPDFLFAPLTLSSGRPQAGA